LLSLILNEPAHLPQLCCVVADAILVPVLDKDQGVGTRSKIDAILCSHLVYANHNLSTQKELLTQETPTSAVICMALTHPSDKKPTVKENYSC